jgi:predicted Zn finger-like uncharacterized protein
MTIDAPCPNCGTIYTVRRELIGKRTKCTRCGTPFTIAESTTSYTPPPSTPPPPQQPVFPDIPIHQTYPPHPAPQIEPSAAARSSGAHKHAADFFGFEQDTSRPRYPAMKMVARGYEFFAILILLFAVVTLIIGIVKVIRVPQAFLEILVSSGLMFAWALATALMCLFVAQATRLILQIEQNTRETGDACRRLADHLTAIQTEQ